MHRERPRLWHLWAGLFAAVALTVALGVAIPGERRPSTTTPPQAPGFEAQPAPAATPPATAETADQLRERADRLYRAKRFTQASAAVAGSSDPDLANLAALYAQLARAWDTGMGGTPVRRAFRALREAWKLDTVLGGAFGDELQQRLALVAPQAAAAYLDDGDDGAAELALHTAETLGVHDATTRRVADALARHATTAN